MMKMKLGAGCVGPGPRISCCSGKIPIASAVANNDSIHNVGVANFMMALDDGKVMKSVGG